MESKGVIILSFLAFSFESHAWGDDKSLKECAELLPKGHKFEYAISGSVDTTKDKVEFKVNMSLSDGSGKPKPELEEASKPFVKCVSKIIK